MVLNPNENYLEVEKPALSSTLPSPTELSDEPAEKRERKEDKESKKKKEFYGKYRNPQKETETERIPIRVREYEDGAAQRCREKGHNLKMLSCGNKRMHSSKTGLMGWADRVTV